MKKRGQITIFIILGATIFLVSIFLLSFTKEVTESSLSDEQDRFYTELLQREGLRLFVEDCLEDPLDEALELIGKQGRLWADQPGGIVAFSKDLGVRVAGEEDVKGARVFFGIRNELRSSDNVYPCNSVDAPPDLCTYSFPNTTIGFGDRERILNVIEGDLERYLQEETKRCVKQFVNEEISNDAVISETEFTMDVELKAEALHVDVEYPLRFVVRGKEFFTNSKFNMVVKTRFKRFLDSVVSLALRWDEKYADFEFTSDTLKKNSFSYQSEKDISNCEGIGPYTCELSLTAMQTFDVEMERQSVDGHDLFIFKGPDFFYRVARQNRPPALDYVNRKACPVSYDYLVIKEDPTLKDVDITLNAVDPDEESKEVKYFFEGLPTGWDQFVKGNKMVIPPPELTLEKYEFKVRVEDEHGLSDWQNVRIAVDKPLDSEISFNLPYKVLDNNVLVDYKVYSQNLGTYMVSKEDPLFLEFRYPSVNLQGQEVNARITKNGNEIPIVTALSKGSNLFCIPSGTSCLIDDYKDINDFGKIDYKDGDKLKLDVDVNFCGGYKDEKQQELEVRMVECIPHRNEEYPFAAPYNDWKNEKGKIVRVQTPINPFLATHSCCADDFKIKNSGDCFVNPEKTCGGNVGKIDYILEEQYATCDKGRGNLCGDPKYREVKDANGKIICPDPAIHTTCSKVASECSGREQYSLEQKKDGFWCNGPAGCGLDKKACESEIVYTVDTPSNIFQNNVAVGKDFNKYQCGCDSTSAKDKKVCYDFVSGKPGVCEDIGTTSSVYKCVT